MSLRSRFDEPDRKYLTKAAFEGVSEVTDDFCCPHCQVPVDENDYEFMKGTTEPVFCYAIAMEYGGNPEDWKELWECNSCHRLYWLDNANY